MEGTTTLYNFDIEIYGWYVDRSERILAGMAMDHGATRQQVGDRHALTHKDLLRESDSNFYYITMVGARIWIKAALVVNGRVPKEVYLAEGMRLERDTQAIMDALSTVAATKISQSDLFATDENCRNGHEVWKIHSLDRGMYSCQVKTGVLPTSNHHKWLPERGWTRSRQG